MAKRHLAEAEAAAAQGRHHLTRQEQLIGELRRGGYDTAHAEDLLRTFQESQRLHEDHRDLLRKQLGLD